MAVNKVVYGTETLIDLTDDTATEVDVASGKKFHLANGVQATGTASVGGTQNTWYGTCPTGATSQTKVVTTSSGDFSLETGSMVRVKFTNAQTYNGGIKLNVDGTGAHNVMRQGTTVTVRYFYLAGEVVDFVFDGTNYIAVNEGIATTSYYGVTKLSSATNSTSAAMAATPAAVKAAYDHASSKQDALVSGENIKTINGESILGSGDITVGGGGSSGLALNIIIENGSKYKLDKTVSEIVQALNSGISPVFIETNGAYKKYYPLKSVNLDSHTYNDDCLSISCTGYADNFSAIGSSAYPSFTISGSGGSND